MTDEPTRRQTRTVTVAVGADVASVTVTDRGEGHPFLMLHGGGGPATVESWADQLAATRPARVLTPVHPGFAGTDRPNALSSVRDLARLHLAVLESLDLHDVTVVGNSIGGWIAAEMAVVGSARIGSYVLVDAVGPEVAGHPVADFFSLTPAELAERSYHDPQTFGLDPASLSAPARAVMLGNRAALEVYAGHAMTDPTLLGRLADVAAPVLVVWGEADRIGDPAMGRALAAAVPGAEFTLLAQTGHLPQIETPEALTDVVWDFADRHATGRPSA